MRLRRVLAFLFATSLWSISAGAAEITVLPVSAGDQTVITIVGMLKLADGDAFATVASAHDSALVVLISDGGNLLAGLRIGQLIRLRHFATLVPDGARCASACAIAWLGGTKRFMQPSALIGFHAAFSIENGVVTETGAGNALVGAYLSRLGLSDAAILYIEQAHPNQINWLTKEDAREVGIEVAILPPHQPGASSQQPTPRYRPELAPRTSSTATAPIAQTATTFAADYFSHWSETNDNALKYFESVYAERVEFYGKLTSRSVLIEQKRKFAERWPERVYTVRPSSVTTRCNATTATCVLEGIVDWDARRGEGDARSLGAANFTLKVTVQHGAATIESESGSVISRDVSGE
jgi:hypothetical protein